MGWDWRPSRMVLGALTDGRPRDVREIAALTGLGRKAADNALRRCWMDGDLLRAELPVTAEGGLGPRRHLYVLAGGAVEGSGYRFVRYDTAAKRVESKAALIVAFLRARPREAFFSRQIVDALKERGVRPTDIMPNVRRWERRGLVYVRGYRTHDCEIPFEDGYVLTLIDPATPRDEAVLAASERAKRALEGRILSSKPFLQRIGMVRDLIIDATGDGEILDAGYLRSRLGCSDHQFEQAIARAMQLYPDLRELKLFGEYRYYHHASMSPEDLRAAVALKQGYLRKTKEQENRVGHNYEAAVQWFIDRFTKATFWTQEHRAGGSRCPRL